MKVKLINCPKVFRETFPPYGLGVVNAFLNNNSIKSSIFDLDIITKYHNSLKKDSFAVNLDYLRNNYDNIYSILKLKKFNFYLDLQFERMLKKVNLNDVDVIGLNSFDNEVYTSLYLAKKIKERKDCTIVIGGTHIVRLNYDRLKYLIDELNVDYVDYFVGRKTFEFFSKLDENKLHKNSRKAEIFPDKTIFQKSSTREKPGNIDLDIPLYNKKHLELYKIDMNKIKFFYPKLKNALIDKFESIKDGKPVLILPYIFMTGCTNNCAFCFAGLQKPTKVDIETVVSKIKIMKERYRCENFYFLNNNLIMDKGYANNLFRRISDETNIRWSDACSIKGLDDSTLKHMKNSGCIQLLFGLESASQKMLKYVHKNIDYNNLEYYTKCFKDCDKNDIWVVVDMIGGFPYETEDDIKRSLSYLDKNQKFINGIFILFFTMYHSSVMNYNPKKYGLELVDEKTIRKEIKSRFGKDVDVYRKVYYRDIPFNEIDSGLNWWEKQKQIKRTTQVLNEYVSNKFKTHFYIHYPIFFLYNLFDGNKTDIVQFLVS